MHNFVILAQLALALSIASHDAQEQGKPMTHTAKGTFIVSSIDR